MARKKQEKVDYAGKSIGDVLRDIKKIHGKDSIRLMDQEDESGDVEVISTGSMWVDSALGINGLPRGRVVEVLGPESGGKTTLALHCVAEAQKAGGVALYIDAEHAIDMAFAKKIGVDPSNFVLCQPDSGEQALDILEKAVSSGKFAIAVVDSVSALVPQAEIDGSVGDSHMGLQARLMGQGLRKITSAVSKTKTLVIFINQIRMKIGVMFGCFHADTLVSFSNGSFHTIKEVVDKRLVGPVYSYDMATKTFKDKKITNWFSNGSLQLQAGETWHNFTISPAGQKSLRMYFSCTPGHMILPFGSSKYVPAHTLRTGDFITSWRVNMGTGGRLTMDPQPVGIVSIDTSSKRKLKNKNKYDIEVAGSSNYLVGGGTRGVVVHNSPETTSGGQALKFFASIRIDIRRIGALKEKERVIGNKVRVKIIKNKLASPYKEIETDLIFGYGFSKEAELLQMADDLEVVDIHGSTYSFGKTVIGRGRLTAVAALQKDKDLFDNILAEVRIQQASGKVSKKDQEDNDEA